METVRLIAGYIDRPNLFFCGCLIALIAFSFIGSVRYLRLSLVGISVLSLLIAAGISFDVPDYLTVDYFAVAFFVLISVFGLATAILIKNRRKALNIALNATCVLLIIIALQFDLFLNGRFFGYSFIRWPFETGVFGYYVTGVFLPALILYVAWYSLRVPDQRKERLFRSTTISVFVYWSLFLCYPLIVQNNIIYNSFAFDSITRNFFFGSDVDAINRRFETRLHLAAENGDLSKIRSLLKAGANPYAETRTGNYRTPLRFAVGANNLVAFKLILDSMDNVDFRDTDGQSLVHIAAEGKSSEFLEYLMRRNPSAGSVRSPDKLLQLSPIHRVATLRGSRRDADKKIQILLQNGANVNSEARFGETPLYFAVRLADVGAVNELLKHGAKTDILNSRDQTVLQIALEAKQKCEKKCSPIIKDPKQFVKNLSEIIEILENHKSQIEEIQIHLN
jgi:ankyrin repeat protein